VLFDLFLSSACLVAPLYMSGCTLASHWERGNVAVHGDISCRIRRKRRRTTRRTEFLHLRFHLCKVSFVEPCCLLKEKGKRDLESSGPGHNLDMDQPSGRMYQQVFPCQTVSIVLFLVESSQYIQSSSLLFEALEMIFHKARSLVEFQSTYLTSEQFI
jgi:hypothetical protein